MPKKKNKFDGFEAAKARSTKKDRKPSKVADKHKGKPKPESKAGQSKLHIPQYPLSPEEMLLEKLRASVDQSLNVKQLLADEELREKLKGTSVLDLLRSLEKDRKVEDVGNAKFRLDIRDEVYTAKLETARDGRAWVQIQELGQEVALDTREPLKAFHGDMVRIKIKDRKKGRVEAKLLEVLKPARTQFVGTIDSNGRSAYLVPQESRIRPDFHIPNDKLGGARHGDKVLVKITGWRHEKPDAEVIRVLGQAGAHNTEMHAIVLEFGLETHFPPEVQAIADAIPDQIPAEEVARRRDMRSTLTFTIDPEDAKDFDDAISYKELGDGIIELGVHIADVSHYLRPGTMLDEDAYSRATSVYLVDRTIPMLPERLSNDLCSLKPNVDRLCFSAVFHIDNHGSIRQEWFGRTVIHSDRRFTYEEVQQILDNGAQRPEDARFIAELTYLNQLAHVLRRERFAQGSISFETEEVKFKLDEQFRPVEVYKKIRKDAHKLIEDFMLLANRRVAAFVAKHRKPPHEVPFVYRIHDVPMPEKLQNLRQFVGSFGYRLEVDDKKKISKSINRLVTDVVGKPEEALIQTVAIRSMPKAVYTVHNIGHYGLGFEYYTHFTSPIRRYPDVLSHRILQQVLDGNILVNEEELEEMCIHCSEREKRAAEAERASIKYKQVEYLGAIIGQQAEGIISGVTDWGIYVELDGNKCEGMIPLRDLHDDHYELDEKNYLLRGKRRGNVFRLGDRLRIEVKKTNLAKRIADFKLIGRV